MTAVSEIRLAPGDILYREGDPNDCAYIVQSGEIVLFRKVDGVRVNLERRLAGSIVGELSILTGQARIVTVAAMTNCVVYQISAQQILTRFETLDPILRACVETSIAFSKTFEQNADGDKPDITIAPSTLRNWPQLVAQLRIEADLLKGLKRKEFSIVYQPIVRLPYGEIVGFEALMRWDHPTQGAVPPDLFIAAAETGGLMGAFTTFAIEKACATLQKLRNNHSGSDDLFMSINISGQDIVQPEFLTVLERAFELYQIPPACIKLELTETVCIGELGLAPENLNRIRALGCGVSVDDFGTGYSNLAYLKSLPLTALKIDRAFAGDAHANNVSKGIVSMLVTLGENLNIDVIAEGVETHADVEVLTALGCKLAQGFHFAKPMPEEDLHALVANTVESRDVA